MRPQANDGFSQAQRKAIRDAGGVGLTFMSAAVALVFGLILLVLGVVVARWFILDVFGSAPGESGASVREWLDSFDLTWLFVTLAVGILASVGLWLAGSAISTTKLERAGVPGARVITRRAGVRGTLLQTGLSVVSGPLVGLVGLLSSVIGPWWILAIYSVLSIASSLVIGWLAGPRAWLIAARRVSSTAVER